MNIAFDKFEQQVFFNTVLIHNLDDNEFGTGFLIQKPYDENRIKFLLFSNKHVFWGRKDKDNPKIKKTIEITLHKRENDGTYKLGTVNKFRIPISRGQDGYFEDSHKEIDVAAINISDAFNQNMDLHVRAVGLDLFVDFEKDLLFSGQRILFVGYPTGFFDKKNFLPVVRSGVISSIPHIDFEGKPQILIDAQVFPGSSGSPVFVETGGSQKFLGMISEGVIKGLDYVNVKDVNDNETTRKINAIPIQFVGLGVLFKNIVIKQIYERF